MGQDGRMQVRPISPPRLVEEVADQIAERAPERRLRVAVDGAEAAEPDELAAALIDPLRVRAREALQVRTTDFLRPASVRFEEGRTNPDAFYKRWLDEPGLRREVLDRLGPGGDGRVLPSLWDPLTDRATRAAYVAVPDGGVVLVSGPLLLGAGLEFDLTVHLWLSPSALRRRTTEARQWTLPAYERYESEVSPSGFADVVIRVDDPEHPAVVDAW
jgi:hypothetical protein